MGAAATVEWAASNGGMMDKSFKLGWPIAIVVATGLLIFQGGLFTKGDVNLAVTNDVIESSWKPFIEEQLQNHYYEQVISNTSDSAKMALLVDRVRQLRVTSVEIQRRGAPTSTWTISNNPEPVFVRVQYAMPGGSPDGKTSMRLKLILRGINKISRIEFW